MPALKCFFLFSSLLPGKRTWRRWYEDLLWGFQLQIFNSSHSTIILIIGSLFFWDSEAVYSGHRRKINQAFKGSDNASGWSEHQRRNNLSRLQIDHDKRCQNHLFCTESYQLRAFSVGWTRRPHMETKAISHLLAHMVFIMRCFWKVLVWWFIVFFVHRLSQSALWILFTFTHTKHCWAILWCSKVMRLIIFGDGIGDERDAVFLTRPARPPARPVIVLNIEDTTDSAAL